MQKRGLLAFGILIIMLFNMSSISASDKILDVNNIRVPDPNDGMRSAGGDGENQMATLDDEGYIVAYADNEELNAHYVSNYALDSSVSDLTNLRITDYDIDYAQRQVGFAQERCREGQSYYCDRVNKYQDAVTKLIQAQAQQKNNPEPATSSPTSDSSSSSEIADDTPSAFSQLGSIVKNIPNIIRNMFMNLFGWS